MNKQHFRIGMKALMFFGIFCLGLVLIFALSGIFGKVVFGLGWGVFFVLLVFALDDLIKEIRGL